MLKLMDAFIFYAMGIDTSSDTYRKQWSSIVKLFQVDKTYGVHHGYYEKGIHTHVQAVLNMNEVVGRLLALDSNKTQVNHILDAGCGIGGTMIYLAKKYPHIQWTGVTTVAEHVDMAKKIAQEHHVACTTKFLHQDFSVTEFPSDYFDAIYLLESSCYAENKKVLVHELHRILKPQGRLVVIDVFLTNIQLTPMMKSIYCWFCQGWGLTDLVSLTDFLTLVKNEGFSDIVSRDLTKNVTWSILRGDILSLPSLIILLRNKMLLGNRYRIEDDTTFFGVLPVLTTLLGLKKALTYTALTAIKS